MAVDNYWGQQVQGQQPVQQDQQPAQQYQQSAQQGQQYQQPVQQFIQPETTTSLGGWVLNLFLVAIPIVGLVLLFVWSFGSTPDESKKNWARANLIWLLIAVVLYAILFFVLGISFTSLYNSGYFN